MAAADPLEFLSLQGFQQRQFQKLKKELEKEFPGKLEISGEETPQVTGWFEVMVAGKMVHSKKNGDGFVDNDAKLSKIIKAIRTALA
ncbi:hypothetical protein L345_08127, partial [Ophiophagus hannah]